MAKSEVTLPSDAQLEFDEDTLKAIATVYLEEGNKEFRRKEAGNAVSFFTQGIQVNCKDDLLNAKLYSNRATAYFYLRNYQETLNDATAAVTLQPHFIKAIEKGASACVKLKRYEEATTWCDKGLAIDNSNKTLVDLRTRRDSETDSLQETKRQKMKSMPVTHTATGQERADSLPKTATDDVGIKCEEGNAYHTQQDFKRATEHHERVLKIAKEVGDKVREGCAYVMTDGQNKSPSEANLDFDDDTLKAIAQVYSNRAAAHFRLGNYQETLNDATAAVTLQPTFIKAIERGKSLTTIFC